MYREALSAPTRTDDAATTLVVGGLLLLVAAVAPLVWFFTATPLLVALLLTPLAVFPPLVLRGYYVRTVRVGLRGDTATPSFVRWGELVRDGAKSVLLSAGYLLPLGVLLVVVGGLAVSLVANVVSPRSPAGVGAALGVVVGGFALLGYSLTYLYVRPAALAVFAAEGRLRDGFALRRVLGVARSSRYAGGWFRAVTVLAVGLVVAAPTTLAVVGVFVAFYARVVAHLLYGRGAAGVVDVAADARWERTATVALGDRPSEASPSVQTGRTVGVVVGQSSRDGSGSMTPMAVEPDGGGSRAEDLSTNDTDSEDDSFVWVSNRSRDE